MPTFTPTFTPATTSGGTAQPVIDWRRAFMLPDPSPDTLTDQEEDALFLFKTLFGSRPQMWTVRGGVHNIHRAHLGASYDRAMHDFRGVVEPSMLTSEEFGRIVQSTHVVPVEWVSRTGTKYLALPELRYVRFPLYRFPLNYFRNRNIGDPVSKLWENVLNFGGVIDFPPDGTGTSAWDRVGTALQEKDKHNRIRLGLLNPDGSPIHEDALGEEPDIVF